MVLQYFQDLSRKFEKVGYEVCEDGSWFDDLAEQVVFDEDGDIIRWL